MLVREGYVQHHTDWSFCFASHSAGNIYVVKRKVKEHSFRCSWLILVVRSQFLFSPLLHCMWGKHEWLSLYPLSTADLKKYDRKRKIWFWFFVIFPCTIAKPLQVFLLLLFLSLQVQTRLRDTLEICSLTPSVTTCCSLQMATRLWLDQTNYESQVC